MELAGIAAVITAVGGLIAAFVGIRLRRQESRGSELELAWEITKTGMADLRADNEALRADNEKLRVQMSSVKSEVAQLSQDLANCNRERVTLQMTVDILRGRT